jgi:hypothetical protein
MFMTPQEFNNILAGIESLATVLALITGGIWTYRRFVNRREAYPRVAFDPIIRFVGETECVWLAEVVAQIENRGEVRQIIRKIEYELELCDTAPTTLLASTGSIASIFSSTKVEARSWLPDGYEYIFVEPGVKSEFCACVSIPKSIALVCLRGFFSSGENDEFFFGERLFALPKSNTNQGEKALDSGAITA